jgi:hypothetical protein
MKNERRIDDEPNPIIQQRLVRSRARVSARLTAVPTENLHEHNFHATHCTPGQRIQSKVVSINRFGGLDDADRHSDSTGKS